MELHTPKRESRSTAEALACSPPMCDTMLYPWNWGEEARNVNLSPGSSCSSPEYREHGVASGRASSRSRSIAAESHRRGRPRADALSNLMMQGSTSPSSIKCTYCNRVFPREKSLQAHLRTHTGERPYPCDYPGCTKAFTQSGQLKTHQRLHTGEKPFLCTEQGCEMRFTHANRHCPDHPYATLTRSDDFVLKPVSENTELPHDVTRWLERYKMSREREDRTPTGKNDRKKKTWKSSAENHKRIKSRKGLMMDTAGEQENLDRKLPSQRLYCGESRDSQDSQEDSQDEDPAETCAILPTSEDEEALATKLAITPLRRPLDRLQPKKRWLREACLEQQLAKPLNWDIKLNGVTSAYKIDEKHSLNGPIESSELQWNVTINDSLVTENPCALSITHNEQLLSSTRSTSSYDSSRICWERNVDNKSPRMLVTEQENTCEITRDLKQTRWHSPLHVSSNLPNNLPDLEISNSKSVTKIQGSELTHLLWDNSLTNEIATSMPQSLLDINQYTRNEAVNQDISVSSYVSENETRPTVLMLAGSSNNISSKETISKPLEIDKTDLKSVVKQSDDIIALQEPVQEDNKKWLGALALMELAKTQEEAARVLGLKHIIKDECSVASQLNYRHL